MIYYGIEIKCMKNGVGGSQCTANAANMSPRNRIPVHPCDCVEDMNIINNSW